MAKEFRECPDGVQFENNHCNQIILSWMGKGNQGVSLRQTEVSDPDQYAGSFRNKGTGGKHLRVPHSSENWDVLLATDDGVFASIAGGAATQPFVMPGMIVAWHGAIVDIPPGWALCDGTNGTPDLRNRFIVGAGSTYALDAVVGSATYDLSHTHTGPSHSHGGSTDGGGDPTTGSTGGTTGSTAGNTDSGGGGDTFGSGSYVTPIATGTRSVTDDGTSQATVSDFDHEHTLASHAHSIPTHQHNLSGHTHSLSGHTHSTAIHDHVIDADGTGATGASGSATQSVLPPSVGLFYIKRVAA